jgi:hypothetical protein
MIGFLNAFIMHLKILQRYATAVPLNYYHLIVMENNSPFRESPRAKTGKMRKTPRQTRSKYKDNNPHRNTLAADKRMREIERINNTLKEYLKYYRNILKNKKKDKIFNEKLHPILDQIFSEIQVKGIIDDDGDEDIDDYIERLTEYIHSIDDFVDSENSNSRNALKKFATIQTILDKHSRQVSNVLNSKNKGENARNALNDELAGLFGKSTTLGSKRGGTRKVRRHSN